jgi:hypothetical protein
MPLPTWYICSPVRNIHTYAQRFFVFTLRPGRWSLAKVMGRPLVAWSISLTMVATFMR